MTTKDFTAGQITYLPKTKNWRTCKGRYFKDGEWHNFENGLFHQWGNDFIEFETGPCNYTLAIVELEDGKVITTGPENIQFTGILEAEI